MADDTMAVIGAGAWGSALGSLLAARAEVRMWAREPDVAEAINDRHENPLFLPGVGLTTALTASTESKPCLRCRRDPDGRAGQHFRSVLVSARPFIAASTPFLSLTKGIEVPSLLRMSEVAAEVLEDHDRASIGVLSGPNIAREVVAGQPAATVTGVPADHTDRVLFLQQALMCSSLRVYTNPDVVGCEIGGSVKNVIALAAGMTVGLGFGGNTLAAS